MHMGVLDAPSQDLLTVAEVIGTGFVPENSHKLDFPEAEREKSFIRLFLLFLLRA